MGAWSVSITGNDTAADLRSDYQAAFYFNDVDTTLRKIDEYVRKEGFDETDESPWCDYYYSLADYMWGKGILPDTIKDEAIRLIDSGFGLEIWEEAGEKTLNARKKVLQKFRDKLTSQQPPKKKITVDMHTKPIFEIGDIIALQLQTLDKAYITDDMSLCKCKISEDDFRALNGKYIAVRKVADHVSYTSSIEPAVSDIWPVFQLYNMIFNEIPALNDVIKLDYAAMRSRHCTDGLFYCEGSIFHFRKRKYVVLGNYQDGIEKFEYPGLNSMICFGVNHQWLNVDTQFINAISL